MAGVESTSRMKNPDDYLNVMNVAAGGDGLIVNTAGDDLIFNKAGDDTNSASVPPLLDQSTQPPSKFCGVLLMDTNGQYDYIMVNTLIYQAEAVNKRVPAMLQSLDPVYHPNLQRKPRGLADDEVTPLEELDTDETYIDCQWCKKRTKTTIRRQSGLATW